MEYKVKITPFAVSQLAETVKYISDVLLVPETAAKWLDVLQSSIKSFSSMPNRFPLTEEQPWREKGIRKLNVKGFLVYYLVDEERKTVTVTAVVYGRRDQIGALKELDKENPSIAALRELQQEMAGVAEEIGITEDDVVQMIAEMRRENGDTMSEEEAIKAIKKAKRSNI